eukprot:1144142-Pelagomonas_calceolata.AAC.2
MVKGTTRDHKKPTAWYSGWSRRMVKEDCWRQPRTAGGWLRGMLSCSQHNTKVRGCKGDHGISHSQRWQRGILIMEGHVGSFKNQSDVCLPSCSCIHLTGIVKKKSSPMCMLSNAAQVLNFRSMYIMADVGDEHGMLHKDERAQLYPLIEVGGNSRVAVENDCTDLRPLAPLLSTTAPPSSDCAADCSELSKTVLGTSKDT